VVPIGSSTEYIHQPLYQEVVAIGGRYVLVREVRLPFLGRESFYLVGHAAFDNSCHEPRWRGSAPTEEGSTRNNRFCPVLGITARPILDTVPLL
jgi:hypothetical protein